MTQREETGKTFLLSYLFAGLYRELHVWLLSCVCGVCVLIWRPVDSNITTSFVTLKQRGSSFCSNNFATWKNCWLKMKYIQGSIPLLKHTRNQPRNRKFQEQAVFKPEKQAIFQKSTENDKRLAQQQQWQVLLISCGSSVPVDVDLTGVGCRVLWCVSVWIQSQRRWGW